MLQQILKDMYIDPELLSELEEDQKHVLFFKMRQEQIRKYNARETDAKKKPVKPPKPGKKRRNVDFLCGDDGNCWVWVMGEHREDKSVEQLIELSLQSKASTLAEKEADLKIQETEREYQQKIHSDEQELIVMEQNVEKQRLQLSDSKIREQQAKENLEICKIELQNIELQVQKEQSKERIRQFRRRSLHEIELEKMKRSSQLFTSLIQEHRDTEKEAEGQSEGLLRQWQQQEVKSREGEIKNREMLKKARHLITQDRQSKVFNDIPEDHEIVDWPLHPESRERVIQWFIESESRVSSGFDTTTKQPYDWLHGIMNRQQSEYLLFPCSVGSFLIRISERIRGYVLSYRDIDRCKHYLIWSNVVQKVPVQKNQYSFFNIANERSHDSLHDLVAYHRTNPITSEGRERLQNVCPCTSAGDYHRLVCKQQAHCYCTK